MENSDPPPVDPSHLEASVYEEDPSLDLPEPLDLQIGLGRNLFQLAFLIAFAIAGAIIGWCLNDRRPDLTALIGGFLGGVLGTFVSGFILMFQPPPTILHSMSDRHPNQPDSLDHDASASLRPGELRNSLQRDIIEAIILVGMVYLLVYAGIYILHEIYMPEKKWPPISEFLYSSLIYGSVMGVSYVVQKRRKKK
ncbi:MAG: hypothetical protein JWN70_2729 [Planctomycetaceae bacterium]|nr:hypothetical protein [Planctomycetaceae bacterium]